MENPSPKNDKKQEPVQPPVGVVIQRVTMEEFQANPELASKPGVVIIGTTGNAPWSETKCSFFPF